MNYAKDGVLLTPGISSGIDLAIINAKAPVIIQGETGTGKEVVAKIIHKRMGQHLPFICINCAHLQGDLALSILFGYKRGAFTGAMDHSPGAIEDADEGILFLDEFHRLTPKVQEQILRTMQDGTYCRIGESKLRYSSFRLMITVHKSLDDYVLAGELLPDLRYRLYGVEIKIPPLRERLDQMEEFISLKLSKLGLSKETKKELAACCREFYWQGNVRQLFGILDAAAMKAQAEGRPLSADLIPIHPTMLSPSLPAVVHATKPFAVSEHEIENAIPRPDLTSTIDRFMADFGDYNEFIDTVERTVLLEVISRRKSITGAAESLGIPRSTLDAKRRRLAIM